MPRRMEVTSRHHHTDLGGQRAYRSDNGVGSRYPQRSSGKEVGLHIDSDERGAGRVDHFIVVAKGSGSVRLNDYMLNRRCEVPGSGLICSVIHDERRHALDLMRSNDIAAESDVVMSLRSAALAARARGWSVVPMHTIVASCCTCGNPSCPSPGKHPRLAWEEYARDRAGAHEIEGWWRRWPQANLGVITGVASGLVVLDVDPRHGGSDALAELEAINGLLSRTVESLTGGGGQHLYFRHPGRRVPSKPAALGLDVKGDGGIVIAPPSLHVTGRHYVWESGCAPGEIGVAEMPSWLLEIVLDPPAAVDRDAGRREVAPRTDAERRAFEALWVEVGIVLEPGDRYYPCPFHDDHHPSLHVDSENCRFYCFGCARGGGIGRLRRLVARDAGTSPLAIRRSETIPGAASRDPGEVTMPGTTDVDVVGESRHQDALLELTGGRRHYAGVRMATVANLVPEPENAADPDAVAVVVAGRRVGYLPRAEASRRREVITATIRLRGEATCAATIVGGWEREHGDVGYFGVRLRL